jgi:hypothetical protein
MPLVLQWEPYGRTCVYLSGSLPRGEGECVGVSRLYPQTFARELRNG